MAISESRSDQIANRLDSMADGSPYTVEEVQALILELTPAIVQAESQPERTMLESFMGGLHCFEALYYLRLADNWKNKGQDRETINDMVVLAYGSLEHADRYSQDPYVAKMAEGLRTKAKEMAAKPSGGGCAAAALLVVLLVNAWLFLR